MVQKSTFSFDRGAAKFDLRAGLPPTVVTEIASVIAGLFADSRLERQGGGGWLLDLGAGTGEIGAALAEKTHHYVGLDLSLGMLNQFKIRAPGAAILRADATNAWPLRGGSVSTIFASRTAHLLPTKDFCRESERLLGGRGRLILGGVRRGGASLRARLRRQMHRLLAERGIEGRRRGRRWRQLQAAFEARGFGAERRSIASWPVHERPADSLDAWGAKDGLAGHPLPQEIKRQVLDDLGAWATAKFGDISATQASEEEYELLIFHGRPLN